MATAAERQKRYRLHRKGIHTLCDPERRCEQLEQLAVTEAIGSTPRPAAEIELSGDRGRELWEAMDRGAGLSPLHRVLLEEACRMADRLDRLHGALDDKRTWLRFDVDEGGEVVVVVDGLLAELRQQTTAMRGVAAELRAAGAAKGSGKPASEEKGGGLGELASLAAARRRAAAR
ncbi:hypothetical protein Psed_5785 [Pseudonocardia dioxanivorans CB1190]|uniref:Uncharacterized protein n=1 Tax=Pseudonocardia dioxanivorans (strain ATCC 55486 / DSM 44775 / JCM 13855 / CB1190) TaxID=675635 RepID=F4D1C4_PSEUX|nr:hypothetical protein [Pseudonocardia dioxanivorans]AEA27912.1 hypothetical protein Psed_5785 [Pseudonocardia dioxanivorans CB1190]